MNVEPIIVATAIFSLALGLVLYGWFIRGQRVRNLEKINLISWLLISMFPVLLIFSFFPDSQFSGGILTATVTGAFGAFVFIWWYGSRSGLTAARIDDLRAELAGRTQEIEELRTRQRMLEAERTPEVLTTNDTYLYRLPDHPGKRVGLVTGDLKKVTFADVWVNSENTNMQMSRFYEGSVSGLIRYWGAQRDETGHVVEDTVAEELQERMGNRFMVPAGTVIPTGPGALATSNNVMRILHAGAVQGEVGVGYRQIGDVGKCVDNALQLAQDLEVEGRRASSIIFPLLGTGAAHAGVETTARVLINAGLSWLGAHPQSTIDTVYVLAFTDAQLEACQAVLKGSTKLAPDEEKPRKRRSRSQPAAPTNAPGGSR
jgi:hypothetical protein